MECGMLECHGMPGMYYIILSYPRNTINKWYNNTVGNLMYYLVSRLSSIYIYQPFFINSHSTIVHVYFIIVIYCKRRKDNIIKNVCFLFFLDNYTNILLLLIFRIFFICFMFTSGTCISVNIAFAKYHQLKFGITK